MLTLVRDVEEKIPIGFIFHYLRSNDLSFYHVKAPPRENVAVIVKHQEFEQFWVALYLGASLDLPSNQAGLQPSPTSLITPTTSGIMSNNSLSQFASAAPVEALGARFAQLAKQDEERSELTSVRRP